MLRIITTDDSSNLPEYSSPTLIIDKSSGSLNYLEGQSSPPVPLGGTVENGSGNFGENCLTGHMGYYIHSINTDKKWVILSDSETKPEYPDISADAVDTTVINAPYAGVYKVSSDKAVTLTNETGHTVALNAGETRYIYLIKGINNLIASEETVTVTFTELEDNGLAYTNEVGIDTIPLTTAARDQITIESTVVPNGTITITREIKQAGIYYLQLELLDSNANSITVETDTGYCGTIQQHQNGWNYSTSSADSNELLMVYLRKGENTFTFTNHGTNDSSLNTLAICNTNELSDTSNPLYQGTISFDILNVIPSYKSSKWVGAAQDQVGYFNGYAGGTNTDDELAPGDSVEITVPGLPYTGVYAFQLYIESITGGDIANIRVITEDGYYSDYELTQAGSWTNRMTPPKDMPLYMNEGDNKVRIINTGTSTVKLDDTDCGRLDALGARKSLDFLRLVRSDPYRENSFQYKFDTFESAYAIGDIFSMVNGAHYDFCGTITNIEGKKIYYEEDLPFNVLDTTTNDFDDHIFFVPSKPDVGIVEIVTIAFATGIGAKAPGKASFGSGRDVVAGGDYSFVGGRRTFASYCAAALGLDCYSFGRYSFSVCRFCQALGEYSVALNMSTKARGEAAFAHGKGTVADGEAMEVGGKWNLTTSNKILVYGNGRANADGTVTRSDAYTLDWNGVGWYRGGLKIGGTNQNEAEDVLVRSQIISLIRQYSSGSIIELNHDNYDSVITSGIYKISSGYLICINHHTGRITQYQLDYLGDIMVRYKAEGVWHTWLTFAKEAQTLSEYGITDAYTKTQIHDFMNTEISNVTNNITAQMNEKTSTIEAIAKGRATGYVFDTVDDMNTWLSSSDNTANLVVGDNFYIRDVGVPDYWWDGTQPQELETQKVDLTEYVKTSEVADLVAQIINDMNLTPALEDGNEVE